ASLQDRVRVHGGGRPGEHVDPRELAPLPVTDEGVRGAALQLDVETHLAQLALNSLRYLVLEWNLEIGGVGERDGFALIPRFGQQCFCFRGVERRGRDGADIAERNRGNHLTYGSPF